MRFIIVCILFLSATAHGSQDEGYFKSWWGDEPLATSKPEAAGLSSGRLGLLRKRMQDFVDDGKLAGMVTMLARHGKIVHHETYGYQNIEQGIPMAKDSIFRIFSMTKPITAVALMLLYEEGKFHLDDPVEKYIPELSKRQVFVENSELGPVYEDAEHPPTIRELLTHTAGFDYGFWITDTVSQMYADADLFRADISMKEFIDRVSKLPLRYQPGTRWNYSIAVDIQGYLVEVLSGQSFDRFLKERIFDPLGMRDTAFYVPKEKLARLAEVYHYDQEGKLEAGWTEVESFLGKTEPPQLLSGGAGLYSTANDYMRFCQMLLNEGELDGVRLLSPMTIRFMLRNQLPQAAQTGYLALAGNRRLNGLGFNLGFALVDNSVEAEHPSEGSYLWGGAAGTWFWIDPNQDLIFIGMVQQQPGTQPERPETRRLSWRLVYPAIME